MLLAFGSNLPGHKDSPIGQVSEALQQLAPNNLLVIAQSRFFRTPCFPAGAGPDFVNAVACCETDLPPDGVLQALHAIEAAMGRVRGTRWGARVIDLDLVAYGDIVLPSRDVYAYWAGLSLDAQARTAPEQLVLPHPRLQDRAFVLVPMMDVAPDWVHPVSGQSVRQMHAALDPVELAEIWPIEP